MPESPDKSLLLNLMSPGRWRSLYKHTSLLLSVGLATSDKPKRFSELEDKHFPLFITVDQVRLFSSRWVTTRSTTTAIFNVRSRYQFRNSKPGYADDNRYCPPTMGLGEEGSLLTTDSWESIGHTPINPSRLACCRRKKKRRYQSFIERICSYLIVFNRYKYARILLCRAAG